jgi:hypothetical protein
MIQSWRRLPNRNYGSRPRTEPRSVRDAPNLRKDLDLASNLEDLDLGLSLLVGLAYGFGFGGLDLESLIWIWIWDLGSDIRFVSQIWTLKDL